MELLTWISSNATPGTPARLSFHAIGKTLGLSKQELDGLFTELNKGRYISQYAKKGVDGFTLTLNQKGVDAIEDGSFI